jgi:tRNA pseudouridine38-40 synthase
VESETIEALRTIGAISSPSASRLRFASRTDRGVSALGNVVAFDTSFPKASLLRAMNSAASDLFFFGVAEVPQAFTPRRARARWYRYLMDPYGLDVEVVRECAGVLQGRHDFRRFCKPEGRDTMKVLESVEVTEIQSALVIDLRAREFLRNMVRRMVAAMAAVGEGRATIQDVREALQGRDVSFGLAPPEGLVLMDIDYGLEFEVGCPPTMSRRLRQYRLDALARRNFAESLAERCSLTYDE